MPSTTDYNDKDKDEQQDIDPYPGAFVSLPWSEDYNPYDYQLKLRAWKRVLAKAVDSERSR